MRRRALLAAGGSALGAAFAGCLAGSDDGNATTTGTTSRTGPAESQETTDDTPTTTQFDVDLEVAMERHQPNVVLTAVDSVGLRPEGYQYLFYHVNVTRGVPPERIDFGFRYGGRVYAPGVDTAGTLRREEQRDDRYTAGRGEGWLVFELPADRAATHAALALGGEEWPVDETTRRRLSEPEPPLTVDWGLTEDQPENAARLTFTVTNEGDVDTRFVAALNGILVVGAHSPVAGFNREIPAGETVSWTYIHDGGDPYVASTESESDSHYNLEWSQGEDDLYVAHASGE
ncbi:hypothetical protein [Halobacterium rubrum]|uniref:hypothetical protein n=1 Tax=Halobacterium TaxID=2239 RepID=UPI001F3AFB2A|nr:MULTISPECIES: hypothetical protein [Halobacterium]MDH5019702.1 hypothetical protein [Halobacterium rubrum]